MKVSTFANQFSTLWSLNNWRSQQYLNWACYSEICQRENLNRCLSSKRASKTRYYQVSESSPPDSHVFYNWGVCLWVRKRILACSIDNRCSTILTRNTAQSKVQIMFRGCLQKDIQVEEYDEMEVCRFPTQSRPQGA